MNRVTPQFAIAMIILAVVFLFMLSGCSAKTEDITSDYVLPSQLQAKGCAIYRLRNGSGSSLYVIDCPNSTVGVLPSGKGASKSVTVNGAASEPEQSTVELIQPPEAPKELSFRGKTYILKN